jgi:hypothetical protein
VPGPARSTHNAVLRSGRKPAGLLRHGPFRHGPCSTALGPGGPRCTGTARHSLFGPFKSISMTLSDPPAPPVAQPVSPTLPLPPDPDSSSPRDPVPSPTPNTNPSTLPRHHRRRPPQYCPAPVRPAAATHRRRRHEAQASAPRWRP